MYMRNLVSALSQYGDKRIEVCLFVGDDRCDDVYINELRRLPRTRIVVDNAFREDDLRKGALATIFTGQRKDLLASFAREKVDVALDWATYYGWRADIPIVSWFPDFQHRLLPQMFSLPARVKREIGFRAQMAASERILLSSQAAQSDCLQFYPSTRGRTHIARFAVSTDDWPSVGDSYNALKQAGFPQDFVFLPNQLWQHKNHSLAIKAAGILAKRGSPHVIVATGRGEDPRRPGYRQELLSLVEQCNAGKNFTLLNGVDHSLVKALTICASSLLNPSRFEGWSTTVEEAKAVGTPLLLSDIAVHREQAPGARFFSPDDAEALAGLIEAMPVRTPPMVTESLEAAHGANLQSQKDFADSVSQMVIQMVSS
jgi:glycosyltransferase involved in cell wall biosynthesis